MTDTQEPAPAEDGARALDGFLKRFAPIIFERAILSAPSDDERGELAHKMALSPRTDWNTVIELLRYATYVRFSEKREEDAAILLTYAKVTSNAFLDQRTDKAKLGISIQYSFEGEIIATIGQALNEGITEYFTHEIVDRYVEADPDFASPQEIAEFRERFESPYAIELLVTKKLIAEFGELVVGRANFGGMDELNEFRKLFDNRYGEGAFINLLLLSDAGEWMQVFALLASSTPTRTDGVEQ